MLFPVQNISYKKINTGNIKKNSVKKNELPEYYSLNSSQIYFKGNYYPNINIVPSFEKTVNDNYFQLPEIQLEDGSTYQLKPDMCQYECAKKLYKGDSVIFCAPTGTGKTAVAHYITTKNLKEGKKTIYTTPLKALANDKLREFRKIYGDDNVGLLTGDIKINTNAPIQIMTTEIYNNFAPSLKDNSKNIATVIFDEAHYLGDKERGNVWENSILNTPLSNIQILCLSATIGNSDEFTDWIQSLSPKREVSKIELDSKERYVPLVWWLYQNNSSKYGSNFALITDGIIDLNKIDPKNLTTKQKRAFETLYKAKNKINEYTELPQEQIEQTAQEVINSFSKQYKTQDFEQILKKQYSLDEMASKEITRLLLNEDDAFINKIHTKYAQPNYIELIEHLKDSNMLPAIIFRLSKSECSNASKSLEEQNISLTTKEEKEQIESIIQEYLNQGIYLGNNFDKQMLLSGYAYHHAGELPQYRKLIEELFSKKLLKAVFATSTLSAGINMPARTVVMPNMTFAKYNPSSDKIEYEQITVNDFHQMAGRAGRRGIDGIGNVVIYNLRTNDKGFNNQPDSKDNKNSINEMPDELLTAYDFLTSSPDGLKSQFKPDWCSLAGYWENNATDDKLKADIDNSFKMFIAKNPKNTQKGLYNKFKNAKNVLLSQGFLQKDFKGNITLSPKGRILKMCQGQNPLVLANLIYDEKFKDIMMEDFCQLTGYVACADNQPEEENTASLINKRLKDILGIDTFNKEIQEKYQNIQNIYKASENSVLRSLRENKIPIEDINFADSFSGFATYLFSYLNISNKKNYDSITNFRKITGTIPNQALWGDSLEVLEFNRKANEGNVYKILASSVSILKEIDRICDYALSNKELYPNVEYYKELKENAQIARELLEQNPLNDEMSV